MRREPVSRKSRAWVEIMGTADTGGGIQTERCVAKMAGSLALGSEKRSQDYCPYVFEDLQLPNKHGAETYGHKKLLWEFFQNLYPSRLVDRRPFRDDVL